MNVNFKWRLLESVFLIIFNAIFFLADIEPRNTTVWISYLFIHISYIMLILTPNFIIKSQNSHVFGIALGSLSIAYFVVEFTAGMIFIYIRNESWRAPFIIQVIIAGLYAVSLISNMIANDHTSVSDIRREAEVQYIKASTGQLYAIMNRVEDRKKRKLIEKAYDELHSSPSRSHPSVTPIEQEIQREIVAIGASLGNADDTELSRHLDNLNNLIAQRASVLRMVN